MDDVNCSRKTITIVIAVSVRLYRDGLATTLNAQQFLSVAGTAGTTREAMDAVSTIQPEIAIVDVSLDDALDLMRALRTASPRTRILAFGAREDISAVLAYADAGADGFVTANGSIADLVGAIERTTAGELLCSPRIAAQLFRQAAHRPDRQVDQSGRATLTGREGQVFSLLKQGQSNKEIASSLCISEATVKNHVHHVLEKLQVATRGQAAAGLRSVRATFDQRVLSRRSS